MKLVSHDSTLPSHFTGCNTTSVTLRTTYKVFQSTYLFQGQLFAKRALDAGDLEVSAFIVFHLLVHECTNIGEQFVDVEVHLRKVVAVADYVHDVIDGEEVEAREELALALEVREERLATDFEVQLHLFEYRADI